MVDYGIHLYIYIEREYVYASCASCAFESEASSVSWVLRQLRPVSFKRHPQPALQFSLQRDPHIERFRFKQGPEAKYSRYGFVVPSSARSERHKEL